MNSKRSVLQAIILMTTSIFCLAEEHTGHNTTINISIDKPMVRVTPPGITNSAGYLSLFNNGDTDLTLIAASSKIAERTEIHEHTMTDGLMKMQKVESLSIPAKSKVGFKPGGYHIMLINLTSPVKENQNIELTLEFKDGLKKTFTARGMNPERSNSSSHAEHGKHMKH